jgi:NADPH:quinone reductase-like Zn-dependent oxidoreductase
MKAALTKSYGPADVLTIRDVPIPIVGPHGVLVKVGATAVTAGDLRLRAADFPSISALLGRLLIGMLRPRRPVQGTTFAGRVVEVGSSVTRYAVGDDVFGSTDDGAYAEYLRVPEGAAMARIPRALSYDAAAALPYGGVTALRFLRDLGSVRPGEHVLVVGASGGVGRFAVSIAKHLGAEVTGVCSGRNVELVRGLGADHVIAYEVEDFTASGRRYDVIFDLAGVTSFRRCRSSLTKSGRYLTVFLSVGVLFQAAVTAFTGRRKAKFAIAYGDASDMEALRELVEVGAVRPIVGASFPLERIAEAHAKADTRRVGGTVTVTIGDRPRPPPVQRPAGEVRL